VHPTARPVDPDRRAAARWARPPLRRRVGHPSRWRGSVISRAAVTAQARSSWC